MDEEDARIVGQVREALSKSPAWDKAGFLPLSTENWIPLSAVSEEVPAETGIYALGLPVGICYDHADSQIVYIGSAKSLETRLAQHNRKPRNYLVELLQQEFPEGLLAAWWPIPQFNRKFLYGMEAEALWTFEKTFGTVPICNLDIPEFFEGQDYCEGLVSIPPCQIDHLITLEALADKIGLILVREELEPRSGAAVLIIGDVGKLAARDRYNAASFLTETQALQRKKRQEDQERELDEDFENKMELYQLTLIRDVNLAAWSVEKMKQVIKLCGELKPKKTRAKVMRPFESPFREVPEPHTWGEVALIKARMIANSWQPGRQVWVKVMYGKELLGEGRLNKGSYYGEDRSDLPQRETRRVECGDYELKHESVEYVDETEEIYGLEVSISKPAEAESEEETRRRLQEARETLWRAVEDVFQKAMKERS